MKAKMTLKPWQITYREIVVEVEPDGYGGFTYQADDTIDGDMRGDPPEIVCSGVFGYVSRSTTLGELMDMIREKIDEYIENNG